MHRNEVPLQQIAAAGTFLFFYEPFDEREPTRSLYIAAQISVMVPTFVTLLKIAEQASAISSFRGENDREPRYRGTVFRYFAVDTGIRINSVRQLRYLWIRGLAECRQMRRAFDDHAMPANLTANYAAVDVLPQISRIRPTMRQLSNNDIIGSIAGEGTYERIGQRGESPVRRG
jgi:hypothetical protein